MYNTCVDVYVCVFHSIHVGFFYYTLGNFRPELRPSLKSIQLVCIVKSTFIDKYGINTILEPFMKDIALLEKVHVIEMFISCATCAQLHVHVLSLNL